MSANIHAVSKAETNIKNKQQLISKFINFYDLIVIIKDVVSSKQDFN